MKTLSIVKGWSGQELAMYRVGLKHILRAAGVEVVATEVTNQLERKVKRLANSAPGVVANGIDQIAKRSALAWERGNAEASRLRAVVEVIAALCGIAVDWPGLYPSYTVAGYGYHSTLSAIKAATGQDGR